MAKQLLTDRKIKFAGGFHITAEAIEEAKDAEGKIEQLKDDAIGKLGRMIGEVKPDVWDSSIDEKDNTIVQAEMFVFTRDELMQLLEAVRREPGNIAIDGVVL